MGRTNSPIRTTPNSFREHSCCVGISILVVLKKIERWKCPVHTQRSWQHTWVYRWCIAEALSVSCSWVMNERADGLALALCDDGRTTEGSFWRRTQSEPSRGTSRSWDHRTLVRESLKVDQYFRHRFFPYFVTPKRLQCYRDYSKRITKGLPFGDGVLAECGKVD